MKNILEINGQKAVIQYDPDIDMFRGEFVGLAGGADFYAKDIDSLRKEGEVSLKIYLESCQEEGVEPFKNYSGKFNVRISPDLHAKLAHLAAANGESINRVVAHALESSITLKE
jgi:predicted HicB family RNase H-like nuclease